MHKCINNSIGNVYHLEQFVDDFFPYSQKQLGFDKAVTIRFESDQDNAGVMLGKTAYYDPAAMEVVLYLDGRHPKDVMRSLSHELVHHAQNCRGDFTGQDNTGPGYAQEDPHLRSMEREAYTKGNLIFRDYEDLIKTGKKEVGIDFSKSGEPKMSLKEWKNNELNMLLMKKWGLLKESKEVSESFASDQGAEASFFADEHGEWGTDAVEDQPELDYIFSAAEPEQKEKFMLVAADVLQAYDKAARANDPEADNLLRQVKQAWLKFSKTGDARPEGHRGLPPSRLVSPRSSGGERPVVQEKISGDLEEGWADVPPDDATDLPPSNPRLDQLEMDDADEAEERYRKVDAKRSKGHADTSGMGHRGWAGSGRRAAGSGNVFTMGETSGKISVREAKEITRRIIERIKKESK